MVVKSKGNPTQHARNNSGLGIIVICPDWGKGGFHKLRGFPTLFFGGNKYFSIKHFFGWIVIRPESRVMVQCHKEFFEKCFMVWDQKKSGRENGALFKGEYLVWFHQDVFCRPRFWKIEGETHLIGLPAFCWKIECSCRWSWIHHLR